MDAVTVIRKVESEFDDIYRITTENGLVLDIPETKKPTVGSMIEYHVNTNKTYDSKEYTIMNGILFGSNEIGILVSFGGLLGNIPSKKESKVQEHVMLVYKLI